jgi:hypothetical protein
MGETGSALAGAMTTIEAAINRALTPRGIVVSPNAKRRLQAITRNRLCNPFRTEETELSGLFEFLGEDRTRILALGRNVAVDEFDDRDRRGVRSAEAGLDDAGVAAVAVRVARGENVEQLGQLGIVKQAGVGQTAVRQAAALGQRDQLLEVGTQFAGLGGGRGNLLVLDQRGREIAEQRGAVRGGALKLTMANLVAHDSFLRSLGGRIRYPGPGEDGSSPYMPSRGAPKPNIRAESRERGPPAQP